MGVSSLIDTGAWKALAKLGGRLGDDAAAALKVIGNSSHSDDFLRIVDSFDGSSDDFIRKADEILGRIDPSDLDDVGKAAARTLFASEDFIGGARAAKSLGDFTDEFEVLAKAGKKFDFDELVAKHPNLPTGDPAIKKTRELAKDLNEVSTSEKGFLTGSRTRRSVYAGTALTLGAPIAYGAIERQTGGAITHAVVEKAKEEVIEAYKDIPPEERKAWLANKLDTVSTIKDIMSFGFIKQEGLNQLIQQSLKEDSLDVAKQRAVKYVLATENLGIAFKTYFRMEVLDACEKDTMTIEERNKAVAEALIGDIIEGCKCIPLKDTPVTEQDLVQAILENRDGIIKHIDKRVQNGLVQLYPELLAVFPDHTSFKREKPSEKIKELAAAEAYDASTSAASTISMAPEFARNVAPPDLSNLTQQFSSAATTFSMGSIAMSIGKWFLDALKPVLEPILDFFGLKNMFNEAAEVSNPRYNPEITASNLRKRHGRDFIGGPAPDLTSADFERMGGPDKEDADRVMGQERQREEEPTADIT